MRENRRKKEMNLRDEFATAKRRSRYVFQYECCGHRWWGTNRNNECHRCRLIVRRLPFKDTLGVGWFQCNDCHHLFAGFCRGDVTSPCLECKREITPMFISSSGKAHRRRKRKHNCSVCRGRGGCPIVEEAKQIAAAPSWRVTCVRACVNELTLIERTNQLINEFNTFLLARFVCLYHPPVNDTNVFWQPN